MVTLNSAQSGFVGNVLDLMKRLECRRIKTKEDHEAVFRLRYKAYINNDLIEPNQKSVSVDSYDLLPNCQIFGLYVEGELLSSIRIHRVDADTPWSPAMKYFGWKLAPEIEAGQTFVDGSRFCVDPDRSSEFPAMPFLTVRIAYMASVYFNAAYNISVIRGEHAAFYRRYYGFERWVADVKLDWFKLPVDLYVGDMRVNRERIDQRLPFMQSNIEERMMLFSDQLAEQGLKSVTGLHGNRATNSSRAAARDVDDWMTEAAQGA